MGTRPSALLMQLFICMATQICCGRESVSVIMFVQILTCIFMGSDGEYAVGKDWFTSFHFCVLKFFLFCFPFFSLILVWIFYSPSSLILEVPGRIFQKSFIAACFPLRMKIAPCSNHTHCSRRTFALKLLFLPSLPSSLTSFSTHLLSSVVAHGGQW